MTDKPEADESAINKDMNRHVDLFNRAMENFDAACPIEVQEGRAEALGDRRFMSIAGAQWEGAWAEQWANSIMVEVNKTAQGVEKIEKDYRKNRVTVNYRGVGKGTDTETAELMDGMFRADVYASKGSQAFDNAFSEGVAGGFGAWRLMNVWEDRLDPENDKQRIAFAAIPDADQSVFFDPNSKLYDKSDAKFCFVITAMATGAYEDEYDDDPNSWPAPIWRNFYEWATPDVVRVAEYYEVVEKKAMLEVYRNRATTEERREWTADLTDEDRDDLALENWVLSRRRSCLRLQVMKSVLSGGGVLRPAKKVAGTMIPVIPYFGKRWYIDNLERFRGHVRLAKDPQRIYNAQISKLTETAALAPLERPIFDPEQIAGHEQSWADANLNRSPYSLANALRDAEGNIVQAGPIGSVSPPQLSPVIAALIQLTGADIAELTNSEDGADQAMSNVSADAMDLAATRTDDKSGLYMDNMKQSMQRCGEVWLDMRRDMPYEQGEEVDTLTEQGDHGTGVLAEGVTDPKTGAYRIRNDIAKGSYKVISDVTEQTTTRRDKTVRTLVNGAQMVAAFDPSLARAMMITAVTNMDGEGMEDLQDYTRKIGVSEGILKPTPEEQAEAEQAAQNQQPDPQAEFLTASAEKARADAGKAVADTELSKAKTVETLAKAENERQEALHKPDEKRMGMFERVKAFVAPPKPPSAPKAGA